MMFLPWIGCSDELFRFFISSNETKGKTRYFDFRQLIQQMSKYHVFPLDPLLGSIFQFFNLSNEVKGKTRYFDNDQKTHFSPWFGCSEQLFKFFISSDETKGKTWYFDFWQLIHQMSKNTLFPLDWLLGWNFHFFISSNETKGKTRYFDDHQKTHFFPWFRCSEQLFNFFISSKQTKGKTRYFDFWQLIHEMSKYHVFPLTSLLESTFHFKQANQGKNMIFWWLSKNTLFPLVSLLGWKFHFKQRSQGKNVIFWFSTINSPNVKKHTFSLGFVAPINFLIRATKSREKHGFLSWFKKTHFY